jgi:hypothetical protein
MLLLTVASNSIPSDKVSINDTIYVDDDAPPEWYDSTHVRTIQEAIDVANSGDTVFVYNGVYKPSSNIHVYKELTIIGETKEGVIIEHEIGSEELSIRSKNVKVSTITFRNFRITNQRQYDNTIITNNVFIIDNEEKHWNPEVIFISGENNEISDNIMVFTGTYDGSKNPHTGIFIQCYQSNIINNVITGVGSGSTALHILDWSYWVDDSVKGKNIIEGNTFTNVGCGIHLTPTLRPGYQSMIAHNNFISNRENARFVVSLPSVIDIIKNNIKRMLNLFDSSDYDDSIRFGLLSDYWDENYWDDYDGSGPKIIYGSLQTAGLVNQFFHYVVPWACFDLHPLTDPLEVEIENNEFSEAGCFYDDPLSLRVEFDKIFDRIWIIRCYATNTFDEDIIVRWGTNPFGLGFFYLFPDKDKKLFVGSYRTKLSYLRFSDKWFEFEPGEEIFIDSILFYGVSNRILWGFNEGYHHVIESWPYLPDGEYEVRASLSPYQNDNYEMLSNGIQETILFNYF